MTDLVHFLLDVSHEIIGELVIPNVVVGILDRLRLGDRFEFYNVCKCEEENAGEDPREKYHHFHDEDDADIAPRAGLEPVGHAGFAKIDVEHKWNLQQGELYGGDHLREVIRTLRLQEQLNHLSAEDGNVSASQNLK